MRLATLLLCVGLCASVPACGSESGDPHSGNGSAPPVGGKDKRIRDVADPKAPGHADFVQPNNPQAISGAIVIAVDEFDETQNGKGIGTIYVQDLGSQEPFSGISLFAPSFNPGNLAVAAGDVLDMRGQYTETPSISTAVFAPGTVLAQISRPTATFRYETQVPEPRVIDLADLADYEKGRRWNGMLVRVNNVKLQADAVADGNGRVAVNLNTVPNAGTKCNSPFPKPASLVNDLFDVAALGLKSGTTLTSVVGVVGFFCNFKLAPRSKADIKP